MLQTVVILLLVLAAVGLLMWAVGTSNHLIRLRNQVRQAFAGVDVLLMQRRDEVPALVEVCRSAMEHERDVFERIAALRSQLDATVADGALARRITLENELTQGMQRLEARVENYPELRSMDQMASLQRRLTELEGRLAGRRELFNETVVRFNDAVEQFPGWLFARLLGYVALRLLAAEPTAARPQLQRS